MDDALIDTSEAVLSRLESDNDVAYAEVAGVERQITDAVVAADQIRSAIDLTETGIWWRVFADGAADYRYSTSLEDDYLENLIKRSLRSAKMLNQSAPASYDWGTMHRATHPGWATGDTSLAALTADEKAERVRSTLADALSDFSTDRTQSSYQDEHIESVIMTTTGTAVNTTLDRASTESVVVPSDRPKLQQHAGTTTGRAFLDSLPDHFAKLANRARRVTEFEQTTLNTSGMTDLVLGPLVVGSLVHQLSHYLEIDSVYFGSSPLKVGDRIGPDALSIEDTVRPGSWAARAYDAEGRPTQSVSLVSNGVVTEYLYDVSAAIEEEAFPAGHTVPSLGFEDPPRIHARHLDVASGKVTDAELCEGADFYIERVGTPQIQNEATRTKRESTMPPSILYAKDIAATTPSGFEEAEQEIRFPIEEGYVLQDGDRVSLVTDGAIEFSLSDLRNVTALGTSRQTLTGTCEKHKSTLPFGVTTPAMAITTSVRNK